MFPQIANKDQLSKPPTYVSVFQRVTRQRGSPAVPLFCCKVQRVYVANYPLDKIHLLFHSSYILIFLKTSFTMPPVRTAKTNSHADASAPGIDTPKKRLLKPVVKGTKAPHFPSSERDWDDH